MALAGGGWLFLGVGDPLVSAGGSPKIIRLPLGAFLGHSRVSKAAVGFSLSGKNFLKAIFWCLLALVGCGWLV